MKGLNFWNRIREYNNFVILLEGTRNISLIDYDKLVDLGKELARILPDSVFRSGNAPGADEAFIKGVGEVNAKVVELVLPFAKHRIKSTPAGAKVYSLDDLTIDEIEALKRVSNEANPKRSSLIKLYQQGNKSMLSMKAAFLLRDTLKVTGLPRLNLKPVSVALFYVNLENPLGGGTGHTIKVCNYLKVENFTQSNFLK